MRIGIRPGKLQRLLGSSLLNHQWKPQHKLPFNPVYVIELEPETRSAALVWVDSRQGRPLLER